MKNEISDTMQNVKLPAKEEANKKNIGTNWWVHGSTICYSIPINCIFIKFWFCICYLIFEPNTHPVIMVNHNYFSSK